MYVDLTYSYVILEIIETPRQIKFSESDPNCFSFFSFAYGQRHGKDGSSLGLKEIEVFSVLSITWYRNFNTGKPEYRTGMVTVCALN
jgi:hypothetical protein